METLAQTVTTGKTTTADEEGSEALRRLLTERLFVDGKLGGNSPPEWLIEEYAKFRKNVLDPAYPCYFGTVAEKQRDLYYTYVEGWDLLGLPKSVQCFSDLSAKFPDRRNNIAIFFEPETDKLDHSEYRRKFWEVLDYLCENDSRAWPDDIPKDPEDPLWEFCFYGMAYFVFAAAPSYHLRRSRNLGSSLLILLQPRDVFSGIEGMTPEGRRARDKVRRRLLKWDEIAPHSELGFYGDPSNREWKQYFLSDDPSPARGKCPMGYKKNG